MFKIGVFSNPLIWFGVIMMILLQLLFTYAPFMNQAFHTTPIEPIDWLFIIATGIVIYSIIGVEKYLRNKLKLQ
jgi:magnesium-transporting ATPase (P-type)